MKRFGKNEIYEHNLKVLKAFKKGSLKGIGFELEKRVYDFNEIMGIFTDNILKMDEKIDNNFLVKNFKATVDYHIKSSTQFTSVEKSMKIFNDYNAGINLMVSRYIDDINDTTSYQTYLRQNNELIVNNLWQNKELIIDKMNIQLFKDNILVVEASSYEVDDTCFSTQLDINNELLEDSIIRISVEFSDDTKVVYVIDSNNNRIVAHNLDLGGLNIEEINIY